MNFTKGSSGANASVVAGTGAAGGQSNSDFKHRPLKAELNQIRLCKLVTPDHRRPWEHSIRVNVAHFTLSPSERAVPRTDQPMHHHDFNRTSRQAFAADLSFGPAPRYRALSYTWASPAGIDTGTSAITIDGKVFQISHNLHTFLQVLQAEQDSEWYFIDQICIDQANTSERNHQVQQMSYIYAGAASVHAWLGPKSTTSWLAMKVLYAYDQWYQSQDRITYENEHSFSDSRLLVEIRALRQLMERAYWSRLWIIQELFHARSIVFRCGSDRFERSPNTLFSVVAFRCLLEKAVMPSAIASYLIDYDLLLRIIDGTSAPSLSLHAALIEFRSSQCKDPRDKVFGLLGIVPVEQRIDIDYDLNASTVFRNAIKAVCDSQESGLLLSLTYSSEFAKQFKDLRTKMGLDDTIDDDLIESVISKNLVRHVDDETSWE